MSADGGQPAGAVRDLLVACHRDAFAWARHCCRDRSEAEDVLQATYLKVLEGRAEFGGRAAFRTWLFAVIARTAAEHRRRRFLRDLLALRWGDERTVRCADVIDGADADAEKAQAVARLERALATLPARQRDVLQLVFHHELTVADAATVMAVTIGTARQHYARGKARLRTLLATGEER
jgi:RNA polymerase sigma factor (sigma-70 family)